MLERALFRTEKDNARETDPTNSNNIVLAGNQLVRGVQIERGGTTAGGDGPGAGYAYLNSEVICSQFYPDFGWVSAGECAEADVQLLCDAQAVCAND